MRQVRLCLDDPPPTLPEGFLYLPGAINPGQQAQLMDAIAEVTASAPLSRARTKGGGVLSAAMTNCGDAGWWSDEKGYRYVTAQPGSGKPWPPMPAAFQTLVRSIAAASPWPGFVPDACLINFYEPGAKMGLHQDKDEKDFTQPIITVCLGDDADFLVGGLARSDKTQVLMVRSGDAMIMGGASRMRFHGVRKIYPGTSPLPGVAGRYSLTFRKAL